MFYHIITTTRCNLECTYCKGSAEEDFMDELPDNLDITYPENITYETKILKNFIDQDKKPTLTFYGGEPLCNMKKIIEIMDNIQARYMIQTNAIQLNKLPKEYTNRFHTILTSIDGDEQTTDTNRGKNTYNTVLNNIKHIRNNGYKNEIIARMVIKEPTDIYKQVTHLIEKCNFTSVHWQLDAMFWSNDLKKREFQQWTQQNYNPNITKLINYWLDQMKTGKVLKLYPFLDIIHDLLHNQPSKLRCGSGHTNYTIQTDGTIIPCPIMLGMKDYYLGHITTTNPNKLKKIHCKEPCTECKEYTTCGGRCLYSNIHKPWGAQGYSIVCNTIHHLIAELKRILPEIKNLIAQNVLELNQFNLIKFNGCEIIP